MYAEGIVDDSSGLSLYFTTSARPDEVLCVYFYAYYAYQSVDESYRSGLLGSLHGLRGTVFLASNSSWATWLGEESGGLLPLLPLQHYVIVSIDACIDIATRHEPTVTWTPRASFVRKLALRPNS